MTDQLTPEQTKEIAGVLATGQTIQAIKIYREATGQGLKEAKDFIDALIPELIEQDPERFKALAQKQSAGCGTAVILIGCGFAGALLLFRPG